MNNVNKRKRFIIVIALVALLSLVVSIPSLAKLMNRSSVYSVSSWDGTIATSYKKGDGSVSNPYIISNGSEFAFFVEQLKNTDYKDVYFELSNDIIINPGIFDYNEEEGLKYIVENEVYYVKEFSNEYYDNKELAGNRVGQINTSSVIKDFKGNLNGNSFTIFGLYITDTENENVGLFENLEGTISDIYIKNSVVYGKNNVSGISVNANNSTLTNIVYDGYVINKSNLKVNESNIESVELTGNLVETTTILKLPQISIEDSIKSIKLIGEYEVSNISSINTIKINGIEITQNNFEIDLGVNLLTEVPISLISTIDGTTINLYNLKYKIEFYDDVTSGITCNSNNSVFNNVINKADIYGNNLSAGFIGEANNNLQITQSYNTGNIKSNYIGSGLIGIIKNNDKNITIKNVYNRGSVLATISAGIIGKTKDNTGIIDINGVINTSDNYAINSIINSIINVQNSYSINGLSSYVGVLNDAFPQTKIENLYTKEFMSTLLYNEFISFEDVKINESNVWIYEVNSLPILYIDDLNNPIANINIGKYSWNNLGAQLDLINIEKSITFNIESVSLVNPIKEKYYYITNSRVPLTEQELNNITTWMEYEDVVTINDSGYYVIYAKVIDSNNKVTYMNTDVIALDSSGYTTKILLDDYMWSSLKTNLNEIYLNKDINLTIYAHDDLVTMTSIEYYISNKELTEEQLNTITEWTIYTDYIKINTTGKYVIYAKIVDSNNKVTYINTDYLIYNGYSMAINFGNKNKNYDTNYISNKSSVKLTFESDFEMMYKEGYTHNLISNMLLPVGTNITLIDKNTNKIYKKSIDSEKDLYGYNTSCDGKSNCSKFATYTFNSFKEIGVAKENYFDESINYNKTISNEKYIIIIDFKNTNLVENYYDLSFVLAIKDSNQEYLYQTLDSTIKNINIYSKVNENDVLTVYNLSNDYNNQVINYNSNSQLDINFINQINHSVINDKNIIDTTYDNKKAGLLIKLYDKDGVQIDKKYLNNMIFEIDNKEYIAGSNNSIKINLGSVLSDEIKTLKIKTRENSSNLLDGTYYLKIYNYISDDGYSYNTLNENELVIPVVVENSQIPICNYNFNVDMTTDTVVLDKKLDKTLVSFDIIYSGELVEPNIRISLYEKNDLTAYNQNYTLKDIAYYSSDTLTNAEANKYYIDVLNPIFNLNLDTKKFNNNGYKYVFELYDGINKVAKIEKYFIVR